ncbi:MAG: hypothetical protein K5886_12660 [Lachnospiraceae bacterium]|nr:hypothetical protein [Lachnospiraceae bacterium]
MLQTFLLVLKIIGFTLLGIIGFLILALLLVLFVPVRYKVTGERNEEKDILEGRFLASFLLHAVTFRAVYDKELICKLKILGIPVKKKDKTAGKKKKEKKKDKKKQLKEGPDYKIETHEDIMREEAEEETDHTAERPGPDPSSETDLKGKNESAGEKIDTDGSTDAPKQDDIKEETDSSGKETLVFDEDEDEEEENGSKLREYLEKLIGFIFNLKDRINAFFNRIKDICENIDYYITLYNKPDTREQLSNLYNETVKLLAHIKPRKFRADLRIGREDPYDMGKMLSMIAVINPLIGEGLHAEACYDRDVTDFSLLMKGRARVFTLLLIGYRVYFHKGFRRFLKALKRKES